jgi:hypothetical protein
MRMCALKPTHFLIRRAHHSIVGVSLSDVRFDLLSFCSVFVFSLWLVCCVQEFVSSLVHRRGCLNIQIGSLARYICVCGGVMWRL